jgi:uroporphyrinogen decarboxylase
MAGRTADRIPFVPSIYEHGARLLGRSPGEVSRSADLMAEAAIRSYERYGHDLVTVGIDIYNIEAEALGCALSAGERETVPGITTHPLDGAESLADVRLELPEPSPKNRLGLIADATARVVRAVGDDVWVYACMGGPFSQAVELRGYERLVMDMVEAPESVERLLDRTTELAVRQARRLAAVGASVNLFESWATVPLLDPGMFSRFVTPFNRRVIEAVRRDFDVPPPAVIMGGRVDKLIDILLASGTSVIVADHLTNFDLVRARVPTFPVVRGCVDPKTIERGQWEEVERQVASLARKAEGMANFIWGCGCVSYLTTPEQVDRFKATCLAGAKAKAAG